MLAINFDHAHLHAPSESAAGAGTGSPGGCRRPWAAGARDPAPANRPSSRQRPPMCRQQQQGRSSSTTAAGPGGFVERVLEEQPAVAAPRPVSIRARTKRQPLVLEQPRIPWTGLKRCCCKVWSGRWLWRASGAPRPPLRLRSTLACWRLLSNPALVTANLDLNELR